MKTKNLIVFDMDGVIMDVSASYRDVVRQTAGLFFQPARRAEKLPDPLFELSDLAAVKQSGGLNNDWDLTYAVISLFFSLIDNPKPHADRDPWSRYRKTIDGCDATPIIEFIQSTDRPLASLLKQHGRYKDPYGYWCAVGEILEPISHSQNGYWN